MRNYIMVAETYSGYNCLFSVRALSVKEAYIRAEEKMDKKGNVDLDTIELVRIEN